MRRAVRTTVAPTARWRRRAAFAALFCTLLIGARQPSGDLAAAGEQFLAGDLLGARSTYLDLLADRPSAALYYNLGRLDQELGAAPQAVLWYRRALARAPQDPWARDNLEQLRTKLGVPAPDPWQPVALLHRVAPYSAWAAALGLWVVIGVRWFTGRPRAWALAASTVVLVSGHLGIQGLDRTSPADAVLMADCNAGDKHLPAGSEVLVSHSDSRKIWTAGGSFVCEEESAIRVHSEQQPPEPSVQPTSGSRGDIDRSGRDASSDDSGESPPFV